MPEKPDPADSSVHKDEVVAAAQAVATGRGFRVTIQCLAVFLREKVVVGVERRSRKKKRLESWPNTLAKSMLIKKLRKLPPEATADLDSPQKA